MNNDRERFPQQVLKDIRQSFGFLLDRGYKMISTSYRSGYYDGYWEVLIESPDFSLKMVNDQTELIYSFGNQSKGHMSLGSMIYFLSCEKEVLGASAGMKKYGNLMEKYIDEIEIRLRDDYSGFKKAVQSSHKRYEDAKQKSSDLPVLPILFILGVVFFFLIYNVLIFDGLLSGWLVGIGYTSSSWLIRGVSLLLAVVSVYITYRVIQQSDKSDTAKKVTESTSQKPKRNPLLTAIIFFSVFFVAFAFLIGMFLSFVTWGDGFEMAYPIITFGLSFLLALWVASSIFKRNRG